MVVANITNRNISMSDYDGHSYDDIKDMFVRMSFYTIENYEEYTGPSWIQWYNIFKRKFDEIEKMVNRDRDYYKREITGDTIFQKMKSSIWWFLGFFNPEAYYNNVTSGFQTYASIREKHGVFKDKMIIPKKTIISSRLEDLRMAKNAIQSFEVLLSNEKKAISNPSKLLNEARTHYEVTRFQSEVERLLAIFSKRIGTISNLGNGINNN